MSDFENDDLATEKSVTLRVLDGLLASISNAHVRLGGTLSLSTSPIRRRRSFLAVAAVGLLLAACGNSGDQKASSSSGSSSGAISSSGASDVDTAKSVAISGVPGVTDTEIKYSALGTNSNNPLGTCVLDCFADGVEAYFAWRNDKGGIWGRKLTLAKKVDDELANNQSKALEIISAHDSFGVFSAAQIGSGWGDLAEAGIPTYVWMISPAQMEGHPEIFGNREVDCITCTSRTTAEVAKLAGAKKVATLGYGISENSKQCADGGAKSITKYSAQIGGAKPVYTNDNLQFGLANGIGPEVTAIKDAGADLILSCMDLNGDKTLVQEMDRQGIRGSVKVYHPNMYDADFVAAAGGIFEGDYVGVGFRPFEADPGTSRLKDFREWMAKTGKKETELAMDGWINADLAFQGLEIAGPSFDQKKVIDATNTLTAFTAGGLTHPVDWSRQHEAPTEDDPATHGNAYDCSAIVEIKAGKFQLVGDATKPFSCFPGRTRDWTDPTYMNFN